MFSESHTNHDHPRRGRGFGPGAPGFGPGFGGFGPRGFRPPGPQRKRRGDVRAAIISLLSAEPSNGYGLIKGIAEKSGGTWTPSPGSVYPTLQQLVDEDLIEAVGEGRRTEFTLTDSGRTYATEHADELDRIWPLPPTRCTPTRDSTRVSPSSWAWCTRCASPPPTSSAPRLSRSSTRPVARSTPSSPTSPPRTAPFPDSRGGAFVR